MISYLTDIYGNESFSKVNRLAFKQFFPKQGISSKQIMYNSFVIQWEFCIKFERLLRTSMKPFGKVGMSEGQIIRFWTSFVYVFKEKDTGDFNLSLILERGRTVRSCFCIRDGLGSPDDFLFLNILKPEL